VTPLSVLAERLGYLADAMEDVDDGRDSAMLREAARRLCAPEGDLERAARDAMRAFSNYVQYPQIRGEAFCAEAMAAAKRLEIALSAAPSADEREELANLISSRRLAAFNSGHGFPAAEQLADAVLAAGYRKRPAQGEGVFIPKPVWDWLMGENGDFTDPEPPHPRYKRNFWWRTELRRRLAAKGPGNG